MSVYRYLPHSGVMVLLDEVMSYDSEHIMTRLCVRENNAFLNEKGEFELINTLELMAQSVGVLRGLANKEESNKLGFLLSARAFKMYKNAVKVGTNLSVKATMSMQDESGFGLYKCEIYEDKNLVASANISLLNPNEEMLAQVKEGK